MARRAVESALAAGASDADAWAEESTSRRVRVYDGEVESLSDAGGRGVGVRAFAGARAGYAYGTDLSDEGVAEIAAAAREAAEVADEDEHEGLPDETGTSEVDGLASPAFGDWPTERVVELALEVDRAARAPRGRHPGGELGLLGRAGLGRARELARASPPPTAQRRRGRTRRRSPARAPTS